MTTQAYLRYAGKNRALGMHVVTRYGERCSSHCVQGVVLIKFSDPDHDGNGGAQREIFFLKSMCHMGERGSPSAYHECGAI